ncbi:MAG: hypothetical protein OEL20_05380 [Sulfuritalea sp.]|nr:hypothetical protein [Sulfuritalea sp.]
MGETTFSFGAVAFLLVLIILTVGGVLACVHASNQGAPDRQSGPRKTRNDEADTFWDDQVNPATGLTMHGAVDAAGNPYGCNLDE